MRKKQERESESGCQSYGVIFGILVGLAIGFLLKDKDKKKFLAWAEEKLNQVGKEGKKIVEQVSEGVAKS